MTNFSSFWADLRRFSYPRKPRIAFTDSDDTRILSAVFQLTKEAHIQPFLVGPPEKIQQQRHDPHAGIPSPEHILSLTLKEDQDDLSHFLSGCLKKSNPSEEEIRAKANDPLYQGMKWLLSGKIDGLVSGSTRPTSDVVKAAIACIGARSGVKFVSGQFLIETESHAASDDTPFLFADCAVIPEPSPRTLAFIAREAAKAYRFFTGKEPRLALLSFATRGSVEHPLVNRIREAVQIIKAKDPHLAVDGELQVDAALDDHVARIKGAGDSPVASRANTFIFPNLESGNIGYKLVQRFSQARVAGPLLWGLNKPVSDLSRGCTVQEILDTAYSTAKMTARCD